MEDTMADARALAERLFDILDNGRYDEFTTVVTEDVVKVELQVTTHSAAEWAAGHQAFAAAVPDTRNTITGRMRCERWTRPVAIQPGKEEKSGSPTMTRVRDCSSCQRRPRSWTHTGTAPGD
jgi:ketosteroid isomerase-like protein